jgi:hypothetical protein
MDGLAGFLQGVARMADISGLDWFSTDSVHTRSGAKSAFIVTDPPNALGGLGPGKRPFTELSQPLMEAIAERLADVAWRHARQIPLKHGLVVHYAPV